MTLAPPAPDWRQAWEQALGQLELDVAQAEALLAAVHRGDGEDLPTGLGSWEPPASIGPLPTCLTERARLVLARQLQVVEAMTSAAVRSRQHLEVQRRMRPDDATSRPLFIDAAF